MRNLPEMGGLLLGWPDKKLDQSTSSELKSSQLLASGAGLTAQTLLRSCNSFPSDPSWDESECADCRLPGADNFNLVRKLTWGRKLDSNGKIHPIICTNANVVNESIPDWISRLRNEWVLIIQTETAPFLVSSLTKLEQLQTIVRLTTESECQWSVYE